MLGVEEEELKESKSTRMEKQALAWLLKKNTSVMGKGIAERWFRSILGDQPIRAGQKPGRNPYPQEASGGSV